VSDSATTVAAIDPGLGGGVAVVRQEGARIELVTLADMPVMQITGKTIVDGRKLYELLFGLVPDTVILESVSARPGQGVTSMFSFGRALGAAEAAAQITGAAIHRVTPQQWQRQIGAAGVADPRGRAIELCPGARLFLTRKRDIGRADALLMALWWVYRGATKAPAGKGAREAAPSIQW